MKRKTLEFPLDLKQAIQAYADKHYEGNFNQAARQLARKALEAGL